MADTFVALTPSQALSSSCRLTRLISDSYCAGSVAFVFQMRSLRHRGLMMHPRSPSWWWQSQNPHPAVWPHSAHHGPALPGTSLRRGRAGGGKLRPAPPLNPASCVEAVAGRDDPVAKGLPTGSLSLADYPAKEAEALSPSSSPTSSPAPPPRTETPSTRNLGPRNPMLVPPEPLMADWL